MIRFSNIEGGVFGDLLVLRRAQKKSYNKNKYWVCKCMCGIEIEVEHGKLIRSQRSCIECRRTKYTGTHKKSKTKIYGVWLTMRQRCLNPEVKAYANYGGRGICVCNRWDDFELFLKDMGHPPSSKHTLDRIDVNGNYEPSNCRWATRKDQALNKRNNHVLEYNGEKLTISEWSTKLEIPYNTIIGRINNYGWTVNAALSTAPIKSRIGMKYKKDKKCQNTN